MHTNERGYRDGPIGPKIAGRRRVLVLGDSFAYGMGVEVEQAFPALLVKELAARDVVAEVINSGAPGYATHHEFHLLDCDGPELQPDDVVLAFYVGNDFRGNHTDRFGVLLVENGELVKRLPNDGAMQRVASFLVARSRLALLVARAFQPAADGAANGDVPIGCENAEWDEGFSLAMARRTWDVDARAAWQQSLLWITATRDRCRELGARFHLVLLPAPHQYSKVVWQAACSLCQLNDQDFDRARPNYELAAWAQANDIAVVDLLPDFVAANDDANNRLYLDCHFNAAGPSW
ncbi:MAG: hypothetical protein KDC98_01140, partial [Planctomycetes bacterium]|nr:hypothetical protein [Planctomycetota bacterium]